MEKFPGYETGGESESISLMKEMKEKLELTSKVLKKLAMWGLITFSPLVASEMKAGDVQVPTNALSYEMKLREAGLMSEAKHTKPAIAFMSADDVAGIKPNASDEYKFSEVLSDDVSFPFVNSGTFTVVDRHHSDLKAILDEAVLGETGLIEEEQRVHLGNWTSADYYVVSSVKKDDGKYILQNEIIDMESGSSTFVSAGSGSSLSDSSTSELVQKTEQAIDKIQLSKQSHGR